MAEMPVEQPDTRGCLMAEMSMEQPETQSIGNLSPVGLYGASTVQTTGDSVHWEPESCGTVRYSHCPDDRRLSPVGLYGTSTVQTTGDSVLWDCTVQPLSRRERDSVLWDCTVQPLSRRQETQSCGTVRYIHCPDDRRLSPVGLYGTATVQTTDTQSRLQPQGYWVRHAH
jgi:hypothetical protein